MVDPHRSIVGRTKAGPNRQAQFQEGPEMPIENTDLERRVLAHERILQALIQHMAEQQPEILARLEHTFSNGHDLGLHEHDFTSTAQYAAHFMRMIEKATGDSPTGRA
jgi:hypothetical protein